jgi:uncharacterized protein (DUF2147 family)
MTQRTLAHIGRYLTGIGLITAPSLIGSPVVGDWKTIDDGTGREKALVRIEEVGGELRGRIIKLLDPADLQRPGTCDKCEGELRGAPVVGLAILSGMKPAGDGEWDSGHVLDPESGKTYRCRLRLSDDGQSLNVRGFIGISLFGRSQTWRKDTSRGTTVPLEPHRRDSETAVAR